ncbi:MAG: hypothetical protein ACXVRZ_16385 [Gaiellaceae bacterium]
MRIDVDEGPHRGSTWLRRACSGRERLCLAALIVVNTVVRTAAAMQRPSPLYYPDEYLYSALARSIDVSGLPRVRGVWPHFPGVLVPYLMAPAWLIHDVDIAYRVSLAWGSLWFSLAALPAFALARRVGVSPPGALLVSVFALIVPDAAFTSTLLTEPYAYPLFLTTIFVAVETMASPTRARQAQLLVCFAALGLMRAQLVAVPVAYVVAALAYSRFSLPTLVRRQSLVLGAEVVAALAIALAGPHRLSGYYGASSLDHSVLTYGRWFGADLFVLMIAAGWVVVPGACLGLRRFVHDQPPRRAFAYLTLAITAALLVVAAVVGAGTGRVYERYVFYAVALLAIPFMWVVESVPRDRVYAATAYVAAGMAVLVPVVTGLHGANDDMSPTMLALNSVVGSGGGETLAWAVALAILAVAVGLRVSRSSTVAVAATIIVATLSVLGARALGRLGPDARLGRSALPRIDAPSDSALLTFPGDDSVQLMKTLFWNPRIGRVLVVGNGKSPDSFASTGVGLAPGPRFVDLRGGEVAGPYVVGLDAVATVGAGFESNGRSTVLIRRPPSVLIVGWNRVDGYLRPTAFLYAASGRGPLQIMIRFDALARRSTIDLRCGDEQRRLRFNGRTSIRLAVPVRSSLSCRISLVRGRLAIVGERLVSIRAQFVVRGGSR